MIKVGQEVLVKSTGIRGRVVYMDYPWLYHEMMCPVQVELEKPYYDDGYDVRQPNTYMYRTGLKDLEIV